MKVLIAPMAAMAETGGPYSRAKALCHELTTAGHEVAFCAALDGNYHEIEGICNYYSPIPSPLGLPMFLGKRILKMSELLHVQSKKSIHSFEEVLHFVGAIDKRFFESDVSFIRKAIKDFKPDIVYSEFRIAAIVAAKMEHVRIAASISYPTQPAYASNPEFSKGLCEFLISNHLPPVQSALEIFKWADLKIVPSSYELEPFKEENVVFTGPFSMPKRTPTALPAPRNKIIAYMGTGSIPQNRLIAELTKAFHNTPYSVYIAAKQMEPYKNDNIIVDKQFSFNDLMPQAAAYIHHGGQNSIMTALMYGVPQIICAGGNFERSYNADSIIKLQAGVKLSANEFTAENILAHIHRFAEQKNYGTNAEHAGDQLRELGGVKTAVRALEEFVKSNPTAI
jgi:uncharacterized protein (TIGR00661 family)